MNGMRKSSFFVFSFLLLFLFPLPVHAQDKEVARRFRVTFSYKTRTEESVLTREGRILLTAQDGGILFEDLAGTYWNITPTNNKEKNELKQPFAYFKKDELASRLQKELGSGFQSIQTRHYVICSNASPVYSQWCSELFEHLETAFLEYWKHKGLELSSPEKPLIAIVFKNKRQFSSYAMKDAGPAVASSNGYYSLRTNRMVMYDITASGRNKPARNVRDVRKQVQTSLFNVATIIHEATHQIAFNTGMHVRYADNPVWVTEGMAMFFETPTKKRKDQWKYIGVVNKPRLTQFRGYAKRRRRGKAMKNLVSSDQRFRNAKQSDDAYAEAWALTYHLIKKNPVEYVAYLKDLSKKKQLVFDKPEQRLALFHKHFGKEMKTLDKRFVSHIKRLRGR